MLPLIFSILYFSNAAPAHLFNHNLYFSSDAPAHLFHPLLLKCCLLYFSSDVPAHLFHPLLLKCCPRSSTHVLLPRADIMTKIRTFPDSASFQKNPLCVTRPVPSTLMTHTRISSPAMVLTLHESIHRLQAFFCLVRLGQLIAVGHR